jgi:hypothetical protein
MKNVPREPNDDELEIKHETPRANTDNTVEQENPAKNTVHLSTTAEKEETPTVDPYIFPGAHIPIELDKDTANTGVYY